MNLKLYHLIIYIYIYGNINSIFFVASPLMAFGDMVEIKSLDLDEFI